MRHIHMTTSSPGHFLQQVGAYARKQVRVRVMGAVIQYIEEYVGASGARAGTKSSRRTRQLGLGLQRSQQ
jgi:hypothetical protein